MADIGVRTINRRTWVEREEVPVTGGEARGTPADFGSGSGPASAAVGSHDRELFSSCCKVTSFRSIAEGNGTTYVTEIKHRSLDKAVLHPDCSVCSGTCYRRFFFRFSCHPLTPQNRRPSLLRLGLFFFPSPPHHSPLY